MRNNLLKILYLNKLLKSNKYIIETIILQKRYYTLFSKEGDGYVFCISELNPKVRRGYIQFGILYIDINQKIRIGFSEWEKLEELNTTVIDSLANKYREESKVLMNERKQLGYSYFEGGISNQLVREWISQYKILI